MKIYNSDEAISSYANTDEGIGCYERNFAELENLIERLVVLSSSNYIEMDDLPAIEKEGLLF